MPTYVTTMSPVYARTPANVLDPSETGTAKQLMDEKGRQVCWLDMLCRGGIVLPKDLDKGVNKRDKSNLLLLSGPPGTGKSTFALELCCRLVRNARLARAESRATFNALYVSAEWSADRVIDKARRYGWDKPDQNNVTILFNYAGIEQDLHRIPDSSLIVMGREHIPCFNKPPGIVARLTGRSRRRTHSARIFEGLAETWKGQLEGMQNAFLRSQAPLDFVVIDSLNIISPLAGRDERLRTFDAIQTHIAAPKANNPSLVILVLDAEAEDEASSYWQFVADMVFFLGWTREKDYDLRTFKIEKMWHQYHAWGEQRLKIAGPPIEQVATKPKDGAKPEQEQQQKIAGPPIKGPNDFQSPALALPPYLQEYGIVIYPSIDWHLSDCRRKRAREFRLPVIAHQQWKDAEALAGVATENLVRSERATEQLDALKSGVGEPMSDEERKELEDLAAEFPVRQDVAAGALKEVQEAKDRWKNASADAGSLRLPRPLQKLNEQISSIKENQGFPKMGCTALVGRRGGMKSHLAYYFLLDQACGGDRDFPVKDTKGKNCLLVTLRDDLAGAVETLGRIAEDQGYADPGEGSQFVTDLIRMDHLEVLENEPGKISPEEFFHNIYVAVNRERLAIGEEQLQPRTQVVVVNGLDQLEARFPLIALADMFVPALIQLLKSNKICSIIISAVGEAATPAGHSLYGLYPMADLILRFEHIDPRNPPKGYEWPDAFPSPLVDAVEAGTEHISQIETQRVPGGQIGERIGYLYRERSGRLAYARNP